MKKLRITAQFAAFALLLCGCSHNNNPAQSTTTVQTTTAAETTVSETTVSETTTTTALTEEVTETTTETASDVTEIDENTAIYDSDREKHPFRLGVWLVTGEAGGEYYDETYYCFREGGGGTLLSQSMGIGMGFGYEADGDSKTKYRFEIGAVDNISYLEIVDADVDEAHFKVKWDYSDEVQEWAYLAPADEFSFYSNDSLGLMAQKLYGMGQYSVDNTEVETAFELGQIAVTIRDPSVEDYVKSILQVYFIDRYTGKGYDIEGNEVDLTVLEGGWADMPYPDSFILMPAIKELDTLRDNSEMLGF